MKGQNRLQSHAGQCTATPRNTKPNTTMKKYIIAALMALAATGAATAAGNDTTAVFKIDCATPMHCQNCQNRIAGDLRFEKGVKKVTSSLDTQTVTVKYDKRKNSVGAIIKALAKLGYEAVPVPATTQN